MATQTKIVYVDTASHKHKELGAGDTISSDKVNSKPWAMFRSIISTGANSIVPLVLRGQDNTNSHTVSGGVVDLLANKTYIIRIGLPNDSNKTVKNLTIQGSTDGGVTWSFLWGSTLSVVTGGTSSGTSITDVFTTTVPTKIRLNGGGNGLIAGAWLYIETK